MHVHVISPKDNWILQIIGEQLLKAEGVDFTNSQEINYEADLNYFINWCYWKILYPDLDKPKKTLIWFTHLDKRNEAYLDVLQVTDHIVAKSLHGKEVLLNQGIPADKIHVLGGMGCLPDLPYRKIRLGISGRPYAGGRKGEDILMRLAEDLNPEIFEFIFENERWDEVSTNMDSKGAITYIFDKDAMPLAFWVDIDYWLSPAYAEGGPMDVLNAAKCGIPIISRDIGFFRELRTDGDITFTVYDDLLYELKENVEKPRLQKIKKMKRHTWDNFRQWHIDLFKEINEK